MRIVVGFGKLAKTCNFEGCTNTLPEKIKWFKYKTQSEIRSNLHVEVLLLEFCVKLLANQKYNSIVL